MFNNNNNCCNFLWLLPLLCLVGNGNCISSTQLFLILALFSSNDSCNNCNSNSLC